MLEWLFPNGIGWREVLIALLDIGIISFFIYQLMLLAKGTRGWYIIQGLIIFFIALYLCNLLGLETVSWVLDRFVMLLPVALVILFYPELRALLEELGRLGFWAGRPHIFFGAKKSQLAVIDEIVRAVKNLAAKRIGALIVLERQMRVDDYIYQSTPIDAELSARLIESIFYPGNPLHDGAIVVRGNRIVAASCVLPLSNKDEVGENLHTRHRAGLGISELTDAVVIIISEETGSISLAYEGKLEHNLSENRLRELLSFFFLRESKDVGKTEA
ncbi:TIGR00159 family protein [bacterium]|nr:TIGR00159 family protein [bacterium]